MSGFSIQREQGKKTMGNYRRNIQIASGFTALALLLAYTWVHTGALLAGYVRPAYVGYLAAAGIELSVVTLSIRIGEVRKVRANSLFMLFTLFAVYAYPQWQT